MNATTARFSVDSLRKVLTRALTGIYPLIRFGLLVAGMFLGWIASETASGALVPSTGFGKDGALVVSGATFVDAIKSPVSGNVSAGQKFIPLGSTVGFQVGDEVLVFTAQGSSGNVGSYRFDTVHSVSATGLTLNNPLGYSLNSVTDKTFVQKVPNYTNVTVQSGGILTASPWDGTMGGIVAFHAQGELDIQTGGAILADGLGFRGGVGVTATSALVNGFQGESFAGMGAQGVRVNPTTGTGAKNFGGGGAGLGEPGSGDVGGGGGGGSYGDSFLGAAGFDNFAGTLDSAGEGGAAYGVSDLSKFYFGSGGGSGGADWDSGNPSTSGAGGSGGGIIFIAANKLTLDGVLSAAGANGGNGTGDFNIDETGGGGGGSGGSVYLALLDTVPYLSLDPLLFTPGGLGGADNSSSFQLQGGQGGVGRFFVTQAAEVPEPGSALLLTIGLGGLSCYRRRKRSA